MNSRWNNESASHKQRPGHAPLEKRALVKYHQHERASQTADESPLPEQAEPAVNTRPERGKAGREGTRTVGGGCDGAAREDEERGGEEGRGHGEGGAGAAAGRRRHWRRGIRRMQMPVRVRV